jgi:hypothetical protein
LWVLCASLDLYIAIVIQFEKYACVDNLRQEALIDQLFECAALIPVI